MTKYLYEDLSSAQFEDLVIAICQNLLGIGVQGFSTGPDGGRDAYFEGTAERHPSMADPWIGRVVIQAKHTNGYGKTFTDSDFFSPNGSKSIIAEELPRVRRLIGSQTLEHYMLFSNRRLSGNGHFNIQRHISNDSGLPTKSIYLCGVEGLEMHLRTFPHVPDQVKIDVFDSPLIITPDELSEVVEAFAEQKDALAKEVELTPPVPRVDISVKNNLNRLDEVFFTELQKRFQGETGFIRNFLAAPENSEILLKYEEATEEIQLKVFANIDEDRRFYQIFNHMAELLFDRDPVLNGNKRLTRAVLYYMYWNCDIGRMPDA